MKKLSRIQRIVLYFTLGIVSVIFTWFYFVYDFQGEIVLIPEDYIGPVTIAYERIKGKPVEYNNKGNIVFRIPKSGRLDVNFKDYIHRKTPLKNRKYFIYNEKTGKLISEIKEDGLRDSLNSIYLLVDFEYGPDSLDSSGRNYYSENFIIIKK
ncbi:hypothetical protein IC229_32750 [Spirosoma sp. BT702]|uniref:Uncharacterized protein n=1 Tax=Spirosoma profusum TaxID=2771354 RepID=A0A927GAB5_9BACT|nr:hypothetical protein [Spirosoma profusum]MBD2705426.1 hypothetical protein [Spirosoma profusum]